MKTALLIIFTLYYISANAQIRIGLQGGYNSAYIYPSHSSSIIYTDQSSSIIYEYATTALRGFQAGAIADVTLANNWFLRPSLLVDGKGTRLKRTGLGDTSTSVIELHYIKVPISIAHLWKIGNKLLAFGGGGLYTSRAFSGVEKGEGTSLGGPYYIENSIEFRSHNENDGHQTIIDPIDYGFTFIAGLERQSIQLLVTYEQGLQRVFPKSLLFQEKYTNRVLSLSAVYLFKAKRK